MAREDTQFKPGHKKLPGAGRTKGTPNKPISIKAAMKQYCDARGYLVPAALDYAMEHDNPMVRLRAAQFMLEYGIGLPAKMAPDTGRGSLIVQPKYPIGTDPDAIDRLIEDEIERRYGPEIAAKVQRLSEQKRQGAPVRDRQANVAGAVARAFGPAKAALERAKQTTITTEDGTELELVGDEMPPDPNQKPIE